MKAQPGRVFHGQRFAQFERRFGPVLLVLERDRGFEGVPRGGNLDGRWIGVHNAWHEAHCAHQQHFQTATTDNHEKLIASGQPRSETDSRH